jgi:hypothetical protein
MSTKLSLPCKVTSHYSACAKDEAISKESNAHINAAHEMKLLKTNKYHPTQAGEQSRQQRYSAIPSVELWEPSPYALEELKWIQQEANQPQPHVGTNEKDTSGRVIKAGQRGIIILGDEILVDDCR